MEISCVYRHTGIPPNPNGDLTKWSTFWDLFESSVHNHPSLSGVDKFSYLHSLLEGTASEAISGLKLTSANYEEAIAVLKKRFGNKQQIIARHMEMLLNIDAVTSQYNLKGLRHLYDTVESQVRGLKSLGVSAESYGSLLVSVLLNKLPQELRLIVSRQVNEEEWNLDGLLSMVEKEISARERALRLANWHNTCVQYINEPKAFILSTASHVNFLQISCRYSRKKANIKKNWEVFYLLDKELHQS